MRYFMSIIPPANLKPADVSQGLMDAMGPWMEKSVANGSLISTGGLASADTGKRLNGRLGKVATTDGPFTEAKELIAGYSIVEAGSLAEVIELVKQWPQRDGHGNVQVEIRQLFTAEDLGFSDQQRERYTKLEAEQAQQQ